MQNEGTSSRIYFDDCSKSQCAVILIISIWCWNFVVYTEKKLYYEKSFYEAQTLNDPIFFF